MWQHYEPANIPPPDHPECYRLVVGPVGWPTFEMLMFAKLAHRRRDSSRAFNHALHRGQAGDEHFVSEKKRTTRIKKAILAGDLAVTLTFPDPYAYIPDIFSDAREIENYLGLCAQSSKDQEVLCGLWQGDPLPQHATDFRVTRQIALLESDLGETAPPPSKQSDFQTCEFNFLMRYQAYHTGDVWLTCLNLSAAADLADIWTVAILEKLDPVPTLNGEVVSEKVQLTRHRHNWPHLFLALLFEQCSRKVVPWKHAEAALSLFFNAMFTVLGADFTREWIAHLACLHLSRNRRVFRLTPGKHVLKTLRALFARTYFPSIFSASDHQIRYATCTRIHMDFTKLIR